MEKIRYPNERRTCRFCSFFDSQTRPDIGQVVSLCRKNAPIGSGTVIGMTPPQTGPNGQQIQSQPIWAYSTLWPAVSASDWCGEFAQKLQEVAK